MDRAAPAVKVYAQACPLFVPLVEEGMLAHAATRTIANDYLRPLRSRGVDTLILGCTHYPFLRPVIRREMGPDVTLVDPARETAAHLKSYLKGRPELDATLARGADDRFFVSDRTEHFERLATRWLGRPIVLKEARAEKTRA
jgi:glutamate racemase